MKTFIKDLKSLAWYNHLVPVAFVIAYLLLTMTMSSCSDFSDDPHYYVTPELKCFVDKFYKEASNRGINLTKDGVNVVIGVLDNSSVDVDGRSTKYKVIIDKSFFESNSGNSWNDKSDSLSIEYVVFHELGHFLLQRDHKSNKTFTIMTPDEWYLAEYQTDVKKRKILIDELFTPEL